MDGGHHDAVVVRAGADAAATLFEPGPFDARVLGTAGTDLGTASGLKACFALQSKAAPMLWVALEEAAAAFGVTDALHAELDRAGIDHAATLAHARERMAGRAWRWAGRWTRRPTRSPPSGCRRLLPRRRGLYRRAAGAGQDG